MDQPAQGSWVTEILSLLKWLGETEKIIYLLVMHLSSISNIFSILS